MTTHTPENYKMMLMWGDDHGGVNVILFERMPQETIVNPQRVKIAHRANIEFSDILQGKFQHLKGIVIKKLHGDMVKKVHYIPVSCDVGVSCSH